MTNQSKFNKGISTPIGILIIVVFALIVGGILLMSIYVKERNIVKGYYVRGYVENPCSAIPEEKNPLCWYKIRKDDGEMIEIITYESLFPGDYIEAFGTFKLEENMLDVKKIKILR